MEHTALKRFMSVREAKNFKLAIDMESRIELVI